MRRVLLTFEPPDGGVAENVAQLALALGAHGWQPTVAGPLESTIYDRLRAASVEVHRLPYSRGFGEPLADLKALRQLRALLGERSFDLVHAHSSKAGAIARLALRKRTPTVYSPHCFAFVGDVGRAQSAVARTVERALVRWTSAIDCVCEDERREALGAGIGPDSLLHTVYNGVEPCRASGAASAELAAMAAAGPVIGAIAVLRRQKRLDLLISAAPRILAARPDAGVVVIGTGPEHANLLAHAEALGLDREPRFRMLPFEESSWRYLEHLDLFVLPSEWEAFPIGLLEALACGVPQVATNVGGNAEAVLDGVTGRIITPDVDQIAAAALDLLSDPERLRGMGAASRARRDELFTIERMVAATAAVYDGVAETAPA